MSGALGFGRTTRGFGGVYGAVDAGGVMALVGSGLDLASTITTAVTGQKTAMLTLEAQTKANKAANKSAKTQLALAQQQAQVVALQSQSATQIAAIQAQAQTATAGAVPGWVWPVVVGTVVLGAGVFAYKSMG